METWIHVAEKPSVAREIVSILSKESRIQSLTSYSKYNPVTQFDYFVRKDGGASRKVSMIVTSVTGHLMEIDFEERFRKMSWNDLPISNLFDLPIKKNVRADLQTSIQRNLEVYSKKCTRLVCWLDCDREGENIAFEVINICQNANPRIFCKRAHFSGLSRKDIIQAVENLGDPNPNLSDAADARGEIDLRVGAAFTRFQTLLFTKNCDIDSVYSGHSEHNSSQPSHKLPKIVSYGSCQFPTLGFVIERYNARESFVSEAHYKISMEYKNCSFRWKRGLIYDQLTAFVLYVNSIQIASRAVLSGARSENYTFADVQRDIKNVKAKVTKRDARPVRKNRPYPLATIELQKLASRHLRLPSEKCMILAESLYQEGFISYPRTETNLFTLSMTEIRDLVRIQTCGDSITIRQYSNELMSNTGPSENNTAAYFSYPKKGDRDDGAHPPIHPLKPVQEFPDPQKSQLFDLICRHFLASCSDDAIGYETIVTVNIGGEDFTCRGLDIKRMNWLQIFKYEKWSDKVIPSLDVHDEFVPDLLDLVEGKTQPPENLSEVELIDKMDKNGIGTDATIAQHIKTIQDRKYVTLVNDREVVGDSSRKNLIHKFIPTDLGLALYNAYTQVRLNEPLFEPRVRANLEKDLALVANAKKSKQEVISEAIEQYREIFAHAFQNQKKFVDGLSNTFPLRHGHVQIQPINQPSTSLPLRRCLQCSSGQLFLWSASHKNSIWCNSCTYAVTLPLWDIQLADKNQAGEFCRRCQPQTRLVHIKFCKNGTTRPPVGFTEDEILCFWCSPEMMPYLTFKTHVNRPNNTSAHTKRTRQDALSHSHTNRQDNTVNYEPKSAKRTIPEMCDCGIELASFTSKSGQNAGRNFFSCSKKRDDPSRCKIFHWAD